MNELTRKDRAENTHQRIIKSAEIVNQGLWVLCTSIKEMRDDRLYKELGYSRFEDYAQEMLGMSRSKAYQYIAIAEKLTADFVQTSGQIGFSKFELLTTVADEMRQEITENTDLESTTVRELREKIAEMEKQRKRDKIDIDDFREDYNALTEELKKTKSAADMRQQELEAQNRDLIGAANQLQNQIDNYKEEIYQLEKQIQELNDNPQYTVEVQRNDELEEQIEELEQQVRDLEILLDDKTEEMSALQDQLNSDKSDEIAEKAQWEAYVTTAKNALEECFNQLTLMSGENRKQAAQELRRVLTTYTRYTDDE